MKAPVGAVVSIYYDGRALLVGDFLRTATGRLYEVASVRVQARGGHKGRQHLRCLVAREIVPGARVLSLRWYLRRSRAAWGPLRGRRRVR
jgi:hypothetical protein